MFKHNFETFFATSALEKERKSSLNIEFLGGMFLGHEGPRSRDIPDKNFMQVAFFCSFRQGLAGMSRDLGRDIPDLEKLYARELWADFSHPTLEKGIFWKRGLFRKVDSLEFLGILEII